jgi:hypothetical protein
MFSPRTSGSLGTNRDAGDPGTPRWFRSDTAGSLGLGDYADPDTIMCRLRTEVAALGGAPTVADAAAGKVERFEFGELETMSLERLINMPGPADRKSWVVGKLGPYERQLYESADKHGIPVQLLAVILVNELADIDWRDVLQEKMAAGGSVGFAQIQVDTALTDRLIPEDELFLYARACGMERVFVTGRLKIPQFAIEAAATEVRIQLDRAKNTPESAWVKQFSFDGSKAGSGQAVYDGFAEGTAEEKEAKLAEMIAAAYNSPDIVIAKHPERYNNGPIHGQNAGGFARAFHQWRLFRPTCP